MTNREYELLDFIRLKGPVKWFKVLNAFGPVTEGQYNNAVLEQALADKLIQSIHPEEKRYRRTIRITTKGLLALLAAEEQMQREASVRQKNVHQNQAREPIIESCEIPSGHLQVDPDQDHVRRKHEIPQFLRNVCEYTAKVIGFLGSLAAVIEFLSKFLA